MKTKDEMLRAGEYCGNCGEVAKNENEYNEMGKRAWFCSDTCDKEAEALRN